MAKPIWLRGTSGALVTALSVGCGLVGLDEAVIDDTTSTSGSGGDGNLGDGDTVDSGDGDGDTVDSGDGDTVDGGGGELGDGDASGGMGFGGDLGSGGATGAGGDLGSGGATGAGGDLGSGGATGAGGDLGTGGAPGAGGSNGTGGGPGTGGSPSHMPLVFDDFETGELPVAAKETKTGAVDIATDLVHGGESALIAQQGDTAASEGSLTHSLPLTGASVLYLRAYLFVVTDSLSGSLPLFRFGNSAGNSLTYGVTSLGKLTVAVSESGTSYFSAEGKVPLGQWFCLQLAATVSNSQGTSKLTIDQQDILNLPTIDTQPGEGINYFTYGVLPAEGSQANGLVYWDDVVVDTVPVACLTPTPVPD